MGTHRPHVSTGLLGAIIFGPVYLLQMGLHSKWAPIGTALVEPGGMLSYGSGYEVIEVQRKVIGMLLLFYRFRVHLLGRCLLRSFRALVPNVTGLVDAQDKRASLSYI